MTTNRYNVINNNKYGHNNDINNKNKNNGIIKECQINFNCSKLNPIWRATKIKKHNINMTILTTK